MLLWRWNWSYVSFRGLYLFTKNKLSHKKMMLGDKNVQLWQFIALGFAPAQMWNIQRSGYGSVCEVEVSSSLVSELKHQDSRFKSCLGIETRIRLQSSNMLSPIKYFFLYRNLLFSRNWSRNPRLSIVIPETQNRNRCLGYTRLGIGIRISL